MAATQRDVKQRIDSVKNIRKITRAMEMVAAARLPAPRQAPARPRKNPPQAPGGQGEGPPPPPAPRRAADRRPAPVRGRDPADDAPGGRGRGQRDLEPADPQAPREREPGRD